MCDLRMHGAPCVRLVLRWAECALWPTAMPSLSPRAPVRCDGARTESCVRWLPTCARCCVRMRAQCQASHQRRGPVATLAPKRTVGALRADQRTILPSPATSSSVLVVVLWALQGRCRQCGRRCVSDSPPMNRRARRRPVSHPRSLTHFRAGNRTALRSAV